MSPSIIKMDLPSRDFEPRIYGVGAWTNHLHFAYDLVAIMKPRLLVELGVDRGESYFAFCQAAAENETGTRCVGIDTWQGDEHAGGYDETTFAEVSAHNAAHYAAFSTLRRSRFDEACAEFPDGSIDVLHLDGLHTEAAVRSDLAAWLPKLRSGGILLVHDAGVRTREFGVWKVWDELQTSSRSWMFSEGPGLGVWQKSPASTLPAFLEDLFTAPNEGALVLADYYRARAAKMQERIAEEWRDGSIRDTPFARQTTIQVFYTSDGQHRAEDSISTRIGHDAWKEVTMGLPRGAGAAPLRIDFVSALTIVDLASVALTSHGRPLFSAETSDEFAHVDVAGDAERLPSASGMRIRITGIDPQIILPTIETMAADEPLELKLRVFVQSDRSVR